MSDAGGALVTLAVPPRWRPAMTEDAAWFSPSFGRLEPTCRLAVDAELAAGVPLEVEISVAVPSGREGSSA